MLEDLAALVPVLNMTAGYEAHVQFPLIKFVAVPKSSPPPQLQSQSKYTVSILD